jgi:HEAT repeat protein
MTGIRLAAVALLIAVGAGAPSVGLAEEGAGLETSLRDLGHPDLSRRADARRAVLAAGDAAVPDLIRVLKGAHTIAAREAAACLGEIGAPEVRGPLHRALADGTPAVRTAAATALGRMGDFRDVRALSAALASVPGPAARALGRLRSVRAIDPLRAALRSADGSGRIEILAALAALGQRDAIPPLIACLAADDGHRTRALVRLREVTGADPGADGEAWGAWWRREEFARRLGSSAAIAIRDLVKELEDPESEARRAALPELHALASDMARAEAVRGRAILVLGLIRDRSAFDVLLSVLEGPRGQVRSYAAEALGRLGDPRAVLPLARQIVTVADPDRDMATRARSGQGPYYIVDTESAKSLVRMGLTGGLRIAIENLFLEWRIRTYYESLILLRTTTGQDMGCRPDTSSAERIESARRWMRWFRENACALDLPRTIDFDDPGLQAGIDRLVVRLGVFKFLTSDTAKRTLMVVGEPARPRLERALREDPSRFVRTHAAEILGEIGHADSVAPLARALRDDPEAAVRAACGEALGLIGVRAGPAAEAALRDVSIRDGETADVRTAAVEALGLVSSSPADAGILEAHVTASRRAGPALLLAAARAMARLGEPEGLDRLVPFLGSEDLVLRRGAVTVLREVTGLTCGFDPEGEAAAREAAAARWAEHVRSDRTIVPRDARGYVRVTFLTQR